MTTFVEVNSVAPKGCKVIINLDNIIEIAPLVAGGCVLYFATLESGSPRTMTVSDDYTTFMQFVLQTVTAEDIAKRFPPKKKAEVNIKPQNVNAGVELNIPSLEHNMYTFKHVDKFSKVTIEMTLENEGIDLDTLLEQFENFLRASGFGWIEPDSIQYAREEKSVKDEPFESISDAQTDWISAKGFESSEK